MSKTLFPVWILGLKINHAMYLLTSTESFAYCQYLIIYYYILSAYKVVVAFVLANIGQRTHLAPLLA